MSKVVSFSFHAVALEGNKLCVMVWHYHDDDIPAPSARVSLRMAGLPQSTGTARLTHYRIDEEHSNAFALWKKIGSPQSPTQEQYSALEQAGLLGTLHGPEPVQVESSAITSEFELPRAGVSLLMLEFGT